MIAQPPSLLLIILGAVAGLLPVLLVTATSYVKIVVVLFIVRNAIGVQQTPPNMVMVTLAIILTAFIMAPTLVAVYNIVSDPVFTYTSISDFEASGAAAAEPIRAFLTRFVSPQEVNFFAESAKLIWRGQAAMPISKDSLFLLMPAFMASELTRAFEIGFLLYLPFVAVDLIVSNILMSLGMMMVSPTVISVPFKLLLFIVIDGWAMLIHGLVVSYA